MVVIETLLEIGAFFICNNTCNCCYTMLHLQKMTKAKRIYIPATEETIRAIKEIAKNSNRSSAYIGMRLLEEGLKSANSKAVWK